MKYFITALIVFSISLLSCAQNKSNTGINTQITAIWVDALDTAHTLTFTGKGTFSEHPVKFTLVSKSDTLQGRFYIEYGPKGLLSIDDTIGSPYVIAFDPVVREGAIEFKRRILMFKDSFLELATWKGGPYLFHRK
jgi:hypothetical protein